jgi:SprT-like protein
MSNAELQKLVERLSMTDFHRPFKHSATFNRRLRTTGGRYILKSHNLEINPLMIEEFDEETLIGVIKHELVHYHNHIRGLPYQHKDLAFKSELQRIGGSRFAPATSKVVKPAEKLFWVYTCRNDHQIFRQRRIDTSRYVCGQCGAPLSLKYEERISLMVK